MYPALHYFHTFNGFPERLCCSVFKNESLLRHIRDSSCPNEMFINAFALLCTNMLLLIVFDIDKLQLFVHRDGNERKFDVKKKMSKMEATLSKHIRRWQVTLKQHRWHWQPLLLHRKIKCTNNKAHSTTHSLDSIQSIPFLNRKLISSNKTVLVRFSKHWIRANADTHKSTENVPTECHFLLITFYCFLSDLFLFCISGCFWQSNAMNTFWNADTSVRLDCYGGW